MKMLRYWTYFAALAVPLSLSAQQDHSQHVAQLPILVDGKKTPELIPDELAYTHFILTVAEHTSPTPEEVRRRDSRVLPIRLSKQDSDSLVNALAGVREQLDGIESAQGASQTGGSSVDLQGLKTRWDSALTAARGRLRAALTSDGLARLDSFIQGHVKQGIVIYGTK